MAKYVGNKGKVKIDSVDYCAKSWELTEEVGTIDVTCQSTTAATARSYISDGLRNATGTITIDMDDSKDPIRPTIGNAVAFELENAHKKYSGNCLITSVSTPVAVGEIVTVTVNIQVSGDVTIGAPSA